MKGITIGGSYRTNEAAVSYSNRQFEFLGHIGSSLEHETWQELTGYDAVSTVRGIQMALSNGATLLNPKKNATSDTLPGLYSALGFSATVPAGFTYSPFTIFTTSPATWRHNSNNMAFDTFLSSVSQSTSSLRRMYGIYSYKLANNGLYGWSKCVSDQVASINSSTGIINSSTCSGRAITNQTKSQALAIVQDDWNNNIIPNQLGSTHFDYFDTSKGFSNTAQVYRASPAAIDAHDTSFVVGLRNDLYLRDITQDWVEYVLPSKLTIGSTYRFSVDIRKAYTTPNNRLSSLSFEIANKSLVAGGGYVGLERLAPTTDKRQAAAEKHVHPGN
jgi:hypothetical protein